MTTPTIKSQRLLSLDILRGITIAAMIIVNNPGSWAHMYTPLDHAEWNGVTPTDFVFPFFMFIMGVSMCFSLKKYDYKLTLQSFGKVLKRGLGIYLVGILIICFSQLCNSGTIHFDHMRLTGVLARLGECYLLAALLVLTLKPKWIIPTIIIILGGYTLLLLTCKGFEPSGENILSRVDEAVLGPHMYRYGKGDYNFDPEGFLSTLPGIAHVLIGYLIGKMLMQPLDLHQKMERLFLFGGAAVIVAYLLQYGCPLNKRVWSPTFVLMTCGAGSIMLALLTWVLDVKGWQKWSKFFQVIGVNSLFCFILSDIYAIGFSAWHLPIEREDGSLYNIHSFLCKEVVYPIFGNQELGSFAFSVLILLLTWVVALVLYKKKIYIKL